MTSGSIRHRGGRLKRFAWKSTFHVCRLALTLLSYISHRAYVPAYCHVLKLWGMNISGKPRYIAPDCYFDDLRLISLGDRVVFSTNVQCLTHDYSVTTALTSVDRTPPTDIANERPIKVGNNVFVGRNALLMPGTEIGDNVIVGAGSVVRGSIPADSIVIGNPGTRIGSLSSHAEALLANDAKWNAFRAD
jgi:acetyltransferase-like isoleucine patch superfamily enzyme